MGDEDEEVRITLRMPAGVRDRVADAARAAGRSLNGEIIHRLQSSFEYDRQLRSINEERSMMLEGLERQEAFYEEMRRMVAKAVDRGSKD